jgi:hypothetical protein
MQNFDDRMQIQRSLLDLDELQIQNSSEVRPTLTVIWLRGEGGAHAAVSPRPPNPSDTIRLSPGPRATRTPRCPSLQRHSPSLRAQPFIVRFTMKKLRISGGRSLTGPLRDARRFFLYTVVARTEGHAHDVGVWDLSIIQGPFSAAPCQTLIITIANFSIAVQANCRTHRPQNLKLLDFSMYQSGIDFKCRYSNRP